MVRIQQLETYALDNNIPIMQADGIEFLIDFIKKNNIKTILEIGSAIGYSSIRMAMISENIQITTIEKDEIRYNEAVKNIKLFGLENQINIILEDALNVSLENKYDLIFIDAAKSKYIDFFDKYKDNLDKNGYIITDNLDFHGLVNNIEEVKTKRLRTMIKKIQKYIEFLKENKEYETKFITIGDGIGITRKI